MLEVRKVCREELFQVAQLEREIFSDAWSEQALLDTWEQQAVILGVWDGRMLAGYLILYYVPDEGEIVRIAVKEALRRQGAAGMLLLYAKEFCREKEVEKLFLEVRESNVPAITFYKKHGFRADGIRKKFYTNPTENAILMSGEVVE